MRARRPYLAAAALAETSGGEAALEEESHIGRETDARTRTPWSRTA